jgi:uncharacterized membrane protein
MKLETLSPELADNDKLTYQWAAFCLRAGMYASFAAMGVGLGWWLLSGAPGGEAMAARTLPLDAVVPQLLAGNPLALLNLGVIVLLATPGVTLFVEIVSYAIARNWRYVIVSSIVGAILLLSIALSLGWLEIL